MSLNKFKEIEFIASIFSEYYSIKPEINYNKKTVKFTNVWKLMLLNNQWINKDSKREIKNIDKQGWKYNVPKLTGYRKKK